MGRLNFDLRKYHKTSKDLVNGFFLTLPVFAFYEGGVVLLDLDERNAANFFLRKPLDLFGLQSFTLFNAIVLAFFLVTGVIVFFRKQSVFSAAPLLLLESACYALLLGPLVFFTEGQFVPLAVQAAGKQTFLTGIIYSLGAGFYEEIFFRLLLTGCLFLLLKNVFTMNGTVAAALSIFASAVVFSWFHHIGHENAPIDMVFFLYRLFAGIFLSAVFIARGFAAAVYTHAFYDVLVHLQGL